MARGGSTTMHRRVNVTLPEETIRLIDRSGNHGNRSRFIDEAVKYFVREHGRTQLRRLLEEGAERRAARDLAVAEEWFPVDKEAWRKRRR
jgi:CopG family transcriptional regulator/antitoxin EndoAI